MGKGKISVRFERDEAVDTKKGLTDEQRKMLIEYGFYIEKNCYMFYGRDGMVQGSNFILEPLFHIASATNAKRFYRLKNVFNKEIVIEFPQEDLINYASFEKRCEGPGNFRFIHGKSGLNKIKALLYDNTRTCNEITQLGFQKQGFFAWSNGIVKNNQFFPIDDLGIVEYENEHYYIPVFSSFYSQEDTLYVFEKKFRHIAGKIDLYHYAEILYEVYGDNAIVGLCFYFATLFRDIIFSIFQFFPILNIFGQKGSGKTAFALSLIRLFGDLPAGANIVKDTIPSIAEHVSRTRNTLCHIDEYKNFLDYERIELLKGFWDGVGRSRMNIEKGKKREVSAVDCGIVLTGQEMPTADNALISRVVFLTVAKTVWTDKQRERFEEMKSIEKEGLTQITNELLMHRKHFLENFLKQYYIATDEIFSIVPKSIVEDRILKNWTVILAAFRVLKDTVKLPFSYEKSVQLFAKLLQEQNKTVFERNEVSDFWNTYQELFSSGIIENKFDFRIKHKTELKLKNKVLETPTTVIYINPNRIFGQYARNKREQNKKCVPEETLKYYLQTSSEYFGTVQDNFRLPLKNLQDKHDAETNKVKVLYERAYAWVFDYDLLKEKMNIDLVSTHEFNDDEIENEITNQSLPKYEGNNSSGQVPF